jgi:hypothetical protein
VRFENSELYHLPRGNNHKTLKLIDKIAESEKNHPFIQESIRRFRLGNDPDSIRKIFDAIYRIIKFYPDPQETQYIRTVNRQLKEKRGNCVDYTTFLSAFLRAVKAPHTIRMVRTEEGIRGFNHIYIVGPQNTPMDLVIGQSQDGSEPLKSQRNPNGFGQEVPFLKKFDKKIN